MALKKSAKKTTTAAAKKTITVSAVIPAAKKEVSVKSAPIQAKSDDPEENLKRFCKTNIAMNFVKSHKGVWNHADWLAFLRDIEAKGYFPIDADRVGLLLEEKKRIYNAK